MSAPSTEAERIERGRTLFTRMIEARANEPQMRAEQARRDERAAFDRLIERQRRRRTLIAALARHVGAVVLLAAIGLVVLVHYQ